MDPELFWKHILRSSEDMLFSCFIGGPWDKDEPDEPVEGIMRCLASRLYFSTLRVLTARLIDRSRVRCTQSRRVSREKVLEDQEPLVGSLAH